MYFKVKLNLTLLQSEFKSVLKCVKKHERKLTLSTLKFPFYFILIASTVFSK